MILLELFLSFFQIGLFSIGGGYAAMPLIQNQVVDLHAWLTMSDFADVIAIAEMTPGPIAVNSATFVGTRIAGFPGAIIATAGCILPSCVIVITLARFYYKYQNLSIIQGVLNGLRPAVVAMIASAGLSILFLALLGSSSFPLPFQNINWAYAALFAAALFVLRRWKPGPIAVMAGCGGLGLAVHLLTGGGI